MLHERFGAQPLMTSVDEGEPLQGCSVPTSRLRVDCSTQLIYKGHHSLHGLLSCINCHGFLRPLKKNFPQARGCDSKCNHFALSRSFCLERLGQNKVYEAVVRGHVV